MTFLNNVGGSLFLHNVAVVQEALRAGSHMEYQDNLWEVDHKQILFPDIFIIRFKKRLVIINEHL